MKLIKSLIISMLVIGLFGCSSNSSVIENDNDSYRSIIVSDFSGLVNVKRSEGDELGAYEGLSLFTGDDVIVREKSDLTLTVDTDKYLYAEEQTHFWIEAAGIEGKTKTRIHLEEGSVLCRIDKALTAEEAFEITTSNSSMAVRGTVFSVTIIKASDGSIYDVVQVFNGKVYTGIENTDKNATIEPGQCIIIKEATDENSNDSFYVVPSQIEEFSNKDIKLSNTEEVVGDPSMEINYSNLSSGAISALIDMSDAKDLSIKKEELVEIKEEVVQREEAQKIEEQVQVSETQTGTTITEEKTEEVKPVSEPDEVTTYEVKEVAITNINSLSLTCNSSSCKIVVPVTVKYAAKNQTTLQSVNCNVIATTNNGSSYSYSCDLSSDKISGSEVIAFNSVYSSAVENIVNGHKQGTQGLVSFTYDKEANSASGTVTKYSKVVDNNGGELVLSEQTINFNVAINANKQCENTCGLSAEDFALVSQEVNSYLASH